MRHGLLRLGILASVLTIQAQAAPPDAPSAGTAQASAQTEARKDPHCLSAAGTSSAPRKGACFSNLGSSYNAEQLNSTGVSNPGEALHLLDPSVTIRH